MKDNNSEPAAPQPEGRGVIAVIRDIQSGALAGRNLSPDDRRRCVEHLTAEGYSIAEIAEILGAAERTIARDRAAVREANALRAGPEFAGEMAGQLVRQAESGIARLRRVARERECPHATKVESERAAWSIARELIQCLQRLGYLPEAAQRVRAEVSAGLAGAGAFGEFQAPRLDELADEAARLAQIAGRAGPDAAPLLGEVERVREVIVRLGVAERVGALSTSLSSHISESPTSEGSIDVHHLPHPHDN